VPDSFNGTLRVVAMAVDAARSASPRRRRSSAARSSSADDPYFAAPGDEVDVTRA
jgi:hypothetical protein